MDEIEQKTKRLSVSVPTYLVEIMDNLEHNRSKLLTEAFKHFVNSGGLQEYIKKRRGENESD